MSEAMETDSEASVTAAAGKKPADETKTTGKSVDSLTLEKLRDHCRLIERAEASKEAHLVARVLRSLVSTRKRLNAAILSRAVTLFYTSAQLADQRDYLIGLLKNAPDSQKMDVDGRAGGRSPRATRRSQMAVLPEVEAYIHLLVLLFLVDATRYEQAEQCAMSLIGRIEAHDRRSLDALAAKAYFYFSLVAERRDKLRSVQTYLNGRLRAATLRHEEQAQATLINCLLRNYLRCSMFEDASKLESKVVFPESASNNEHARHQYYMAIIKSMHLDYVGAQNNLLAAMRKAPQHTAVGFKQKVQKLTIVVGLLLGEIPERSVFRTAIYRKPLAPYLRLTQAVRTGDVGAYDAALRSHSFDADATHSLVVRLRQNVIRTAVRQISLAYSRISLADVARKLGLDGADEAEYIVAKAIKDGVIEATVDADERFMQSSEPADVYGTSEPQRQFDQRTQFCLLLHKQAVKALRYPPKSYAKDAESAEQQREREQQQLEFAKELADEDDDF